MSKLFALGVLGFFVFAFFGFAHSQIADDANTPIDLAGNGYYPPDYPAGPNITAAKSGVGMGYRHGVMFGGMGTSLMWLLHFSIIIWLGVGILLLLFLWGKVFKK